MSEQSTLGLKGTNETISSVQKNKAQHNNTGTVLDPRLVP